MADMDDYCEHYKIKRNCYTCHIEWQYEKTSLDTLHETLSELKVRISKLEQYKRLQDDKNKQLDQDNAELNSRQNDLTTDIQMLKTWRHAVNDDLSEHIRYRGEISDRVGKLEGELVTIKIYSHPMQEKVWQENISNRINKIEDQTKTQNDINVILLDKYKQVVKNEIQKTKETLCMDKFTKPKTTGLTFEEAFKVFMNGKTILRNGHRYLNIDLSTWTFSPNDILAIDWEICE